MRENWLEEGLRDKLEGFDSELNLEEAWDALEQKRSEPKGRRLGWLWIVTGSLLLIGSSFAIYQLTTNETPEMVDVPVKVDVSNVIGQEKVVLLDSENALLTEKIFEAQSQMPESSSNRNYQSQQQDTPIRNTQIITPKSLDYTTPSSYFVSTPNIDNNQNDRTTDDQVTDSDVSTEIGQSVALNQSNLVINQFTLLEGVTAKLQRDSKQVLKFKFANFGRQDRVKKSKSIPQFVGVDFGFSPITNGQILADEKAIDAVSANLYYKKHLSNSFYLKVGLGLDRYTTRIEGSESNTSTSIEPNQVVERVIYQDGTIENILGDGEVTTTETTTYQLYNSYQFISVPVVAGLRIIDRAQTNIELEGGMATTISSQYDVKEYDPTNGGQVNQVADLNLRNTSIFSGLLAAQWNYHPKSLSRLGVFMKVGTRFQLNDISSEDTFNVDKFKSYQLGLGLQYRL